jgi:Ca2+/Na+ antiporter
LKIIAWGGIVAVYVLTLATQLPHIFSVYSALERTEHRILGIDTAWGAAIAFEATVALFTIRAIVNRKSERSRWTRWAIVGFLTLSALANLSYYFDWRWLDVSAIPALLAFALPVALWLYAEEFGAEAKAEARKRHRTEAQAATDTPPESSETQDSADDAPYHCDYCGRACWSPQSKAGHMKWCKGSVDVQMGNG